jgi:putative spermidine/putrescine transport system permease protein/spermidine/putrescine transport system permease protein
MFSRESAEVRLFQLAYALIFAFMLLPLFVVVGTSFTAAGTLTFPPEELSAVWYGEFFNDLQWLRAFENSIIIGIGTTILSTILGVSAAFGLQLSGQRGAKYLTPLVLLPLLVPPVVLGITLLIFFSRFDLHQTYVSIILAHSLWATPLVFFIMQSVFERFDWSLRDAGQDLGAGPWRNFRYVIFPGVRNGVLVSALIAFIISLQEFIMALFLSGWETRTIPVLAWTTLRQSLDPMVSVVSTFLILMSLGGILIIAAIMNIEWLAKQL